MRLVKIYSFCVSNAYDDKREALVTFERDQILHDVEPIYVNTDNICSLSPITYKTIDGKRYYGYYILMLNGYKYWIRSGTNNYEGLLDYINTNKEQKQKIVEGPKHLNKKR